MNDSQPRVTAMPLRVAAPPLTQPSTKLAYAKSEAAKILSLSVRTIENLIANKELSVRRVGKRVLVPHQSLLNFLRHDHDTGRQEVQ